MTEKAKRCVETLQDHRRTGFYLVGNIHATEIISLIESLSAELEQVKAERDGLNVMLGQAQSMLETRTRERDAAIKDIPRACGYCKYFRESTYECTSKFPCACISGVNTRWEWRGVKEDDNG